MTRGSRPSRAAATILGMAGMVIELPAVRPIESIVEVVPPVSLALGAPHYARDTDRRGPDDVAARLCDHAYSFRQFRERRPDRGAEPADVLHRLGVVDR